MTFNERFDAVVAVVGRAVEAAGIAAIVVGATAATVLFIARLRQSSDSSAAYRLYRRNLGRALLLGLEFLVAADIIRTVATRPTFSGVGVLALIVVIRTFLSMALELETEGRWPWQRPGGAGDSAPSPSRPGGASEPPGAAHGT